MNTNADQIYSNNLVNQYQAHLSENTQLVNVIPSSANRIIHQTTNSINGDANDLNERSLDLSTDYMSNANLSSNVNIVNYLPNLPVTIINTSSDHIHHQNHQYIKKCESILSIHQPKEQSHMIHIYGDSNIIQSTDLPVLTPLKYMEYQNNLSSIVTSAGTDEQQILMNNDDVMSEKSDCESIHEQPLKQSLPHKKRIAKKLNSDEFSIILTDPDANIRALQAANPQFECIECGLSFIGQLEFYMHLKEHYEGQSSSLMRHTKRKRFAQHEELEIHVHDEEDPNSVAENLIIESLEDSQDDIKSEEIEGDAFGFSEPEDMEDFRKEVEKVVETIGDTECLPDSSWNYQVSDEMDESHTNVTIMESYSEKMDSIDQSNYSNQQELKCESYLCTQDIKDDNDVDEHTILHFTNNSNELIDIKHERMNDPAIIQPSVLETDEEDEKPLEEVRLLLKKTKRYQKQKVQNDAEVEFNECLKKIQNFKCNDCNKCFNSRTALGYHLKTHSSERRYVCDQCGKKFLTNGALKVHLRLHTNDRPYKCNFPDCGKSFRQWGDLKYHETSLHSDKKDHICEFCAKAFARKYSLVIHRRIHTGEKTYKCTECDKSFRASSYLLNHKRIHSGERPFACMVCGKKFRVQGDLKRHTKIHDRVKNGVVKEKKKVIEPQVISNNQDINNVAGKECVDLSKEKKAMENTDSNFIENLTKKGIGNNEVTKKIKKSHKKKNVK
ncbi:unnamed protein product [Chironomus riparius]|uniref:C2H2-type domain-containing protein n=1 Tax=Chironomus riparius TaxID=315576 RepID=A0A9N9RQE3_9DIPT|nr:unnamed protein product [Chironomus riparius]